MNADKDVVTLLHLLKSTLWAGKGPTIAKEVRRICNKHGLDEDTFLPSFIVRDKKKWGLND